MRQYYVHFSVKSLLTVLNVSGFEWVFIMDCKIKDQDAFICRQYRCLFFVNHSASLFF